MATIPKDFRSKINGVKGLKLYRQNYFRNSDTGKDEPIEEEIGKIEYISVETETTSMNFEYYKYKMTITG